MDEQDFRAMAERCRALIRIAVRDEVREQLRQWADDFDAEADALETGGKVYRVIIDRSSRG